MSYEPRGKMIELMAAMREEPPRVFTAAETAGIIGCKPYPTTLANYTQAAVVGGALFRINVRGEWLYAGREITDDMLIASGRAPRANAGLVIIPSPFDDKDRVRASLDPRAPGPLGFVPKPMSVPRPGSDIRVPKFSGAAAVAAIDRPTPGIDLGREEEELPKREVWRERIHTDIANDMEPRGDRANRTLVDKLKTAMPHWPAVDDESGRRTASATTASGHELPDDTAAQAASLSVANEGDARVASGGCAHQDEVEEVEVEAEAEEETVEFTAAKWLDGDLVIYGVAQNEDGSFTLTQEQFDQLATFMGRQS